MRIAKMCFYGLGVMFAVQSMASLALAGAITTTPEIDGSSLSAGLGLLAAGVLLLRARKAR
jgi:hypothetical protein